MVKYFQNVTIKLMTEMPSMLFISLDKLVQYIKDRSNIILLIPLAYYYRSFKYFTGHVNARFLLFLEICKSLGIRGKQIEVLKVFDMGHRVLEFIYFVQ